MNNNIENNIEGKVVVITGANSGLGEAAARHLAAEGASVVLGARRAKHAMRVISEGLRQEEVDINEILFRPTRQEL